MLKLFKTYMSGLLLMIKQEEFYDRIESTHQQCKGSK